MAKRRKSATQRMRTNVLSAVRRRKNKYNIPDDYIESIKTAPYQTLKSLSSNRYRKLDEQLSALQSEVKPSLDQRIDALLPTVLHQRGVTSPSKQAQDYYRNLIKDTLAYKNITEITTALHKMDAGSYEADRLRAMYHIALENAGVFDELVREDMGKVLTNERPTKENTAETSTLIYDAIMDMIDYALNTGDKWQKYLADYLKGALDEELSHYPGEEWKVYKAIEMCSGPLVDECRRYMYGSENLEEKKAILEYILMLIRGYIPSDEERIALSKYIDAYDSSEEL